MTANAYSQERCMRRMHKADAKVLSGLDSLDDRVEALASLRERQARWKFAAGDRVWQASIVPDYTQGDERALKMCEWSGDLMRQARVLRLTQRIGD